MRSRHQVDLSTRFSAASRPDDARQDGTRLIERADLTAIPERDPATEAIDREPYIAGEGLQDAVNLAIALGRPLLVQGDPGVGKTRLAHAVRYALGLPLEQAIVKSTSRAQDLLYSYDAVRRLYDAQLPAKGGAELPSTADYVTLGPLGRAIQRALYGRRSVVLIDEIDKADIDFPNDLLHELDRLEFKVPEAPGLGYQVPVGAPELRPIVIVTDNGEKALPAAFLRRCVFHYIEFPADPVQLSGILAEHDIQDAALRASAIDIVRRLRDLDLAKKPGLSELLDWVLYLQASQRPAQWSRGMPGLGALLKRRDDLARVRDLLPPDE
jgi:MoxR-like ATPase